MGWPYECEQPHFFHPQNYNLILNCCKENELLCITICDVAKPCSAGMKIFGPQKAYRSISRIHVREYSSQNKRTYELEKTCELFRYPRKFIHPAVHIPAPFCSRFSVILCPSLLRSDQRPQCR